MKPIKEGKEEAEVLKPAEYKRDGQLAQAAWCQPLLNKVPPS